MLICRAKCHYVVHHWELSNVLVQKLTYPYYGKQHWFPNYNETCIHHSLRQCFEPHTVHLLQSLYNSPLQLPHNGSFFHSIILFCGLFDTEMFHRISFLLHRPEHFNYSCRKQADWIPAEVKGKFHTINNKDGAKAYFS